MSALAELNTDHPKILAEFDAFIAQAWGEDKFDGQSVRHDPALARTLEWLKYHTEELYRRHTNLTNVLDAWKNGAGFGLVTAIEDAIKDVPFADLSDELKKAKHEHAD